MGVGFHVAEGEGGKEVSLFSSFLFAVEGGEEIEVQ